MHQLDHLSALSQSRQEPVTAELEAAPGQFVKVKVTPRGRRQIIYWKASNLKPRAKACEELGEDAGFFDPTFRNWPCSVSQKAVLIQEGFTGQLCEHEFGPPAHLDSRKASGISQTCQKCGLTATRMVARRGNKESCQYDEWELRPHIFQAWCRRGPVPGSLQPKAHHQQTPEQHAQELAQEGFIRHVRLSQ